MIVKRATIKFILIDKKKKTIVASEKAIRILQLSGKNEDWLMWTDKFIARATIRGYDKILMGNVLSTGELNEKGDPDELSKAEKQANSLNKKACNEWILSCCDKISFDAHVNRNVSSTRKSRRPYYLKILHWDYGYMRMCQMITVKGIMRMRVNLTMRPLIPMNNRKMLMSLRKVSI